jgi:hypothetical protein
VSVDLVGSTAFKSERPTFGVDRDPRWRVHWLDVFKSFYTGFPRMFERKLDRELPEAIRPKLMKIIGDEVLLQTKIGGHRDAQQIVRFLAKALVEYKKTNLSDQPLLLKATCWIAVFPFSNHRVRFEGDHGVEDFIGPAIDTGFRIATQASPSKLMVSVDLALLLLEGDEALDLYFDGAEPLKGVLGARPYPILWYKVSGEDADLLDAELELRHPKPEKQKLRRYCEAFIAACDDTWLVRPYFKNDPRFKAKPPGHDAALRLWERIDARNFEVGEPPSPPERPKPRRKLSRRDP